MSRASALARGRAAAEAGMADVCTIRRIIGQVETPAGSGTLVPTYRNPDLYSGKCRVQAITASSRPHDIGQDFLLLQRLEVQLPVAGTAGLEAGDEITITAAVNDQDLIGRFFLIHDLAHKSEATARRVQVIERTGS